MVAYCQRRQQTYTIQNRMYMGAGATMIKDTHADGLFERAELYLKRYATERRHYLHHQ